MRPILGCDVSTYQGAKGMAFKRFQALDDAGVRFMIARATIGTSVDQSCPVNLKRADKHGWVTGTYCYLFPGNGAAQAEVYAKHMGGELAVLDVEQAGITAATVRDFVRRFREIAPNRPIGCYTAEGVWGHLTGNLDGADLFDYLWQARWTELGTNERRDLPDEPPAAGFGGWKTSAFWQFGAFHVKGFASMDGNAWYGSLEELAALGRHPRPPIEERPRYRTGHNAMLAEATRLVALARDPDGDSGPAWDTGIKAAREDAIAALLALRLGE